jgi:glycosyltransferase involved in cell wall biosynthesis
MDLHARSANTMSQVPTPRSSHPGDSLHVAMAGPVTTKPLTAFLGGVVEHLPPGRGGTPVWQLVEDLVTRGQRVSVVTLDGSVSTPVAASGPVLDVVYGAYRPRHRMRDLMRAERLAVRDGLLRANPDLVHAHWCYEYALGALASGIPTLITVRDWMPTILRMTSARYWPYWSGRTLLYFTTLARARYLTANSPYTARKVRRFTKASLEVVPNGMPDGDFYLLPPGEQAGDPNLHPPGHPVIVTVNNGFGPRKNVRRLLEAYRELRQNVIGCELHLIGDGYESDGYCEAWARERRLSDGVVFLGPLPHDEVLCRMREATLLAHPALEESFGNTLIEAMSQRLPVIGGTRSGAVPWVLGGGKAGLLVDVGDPRAIARAMEAILTNEALRKRLANEGFVRAWEDFRQSHVTDLYLDAYRRVLAEEGL